MTKADKVKIGLIQMSAGPDPKENVSKAVTRIESCVRKGAKIICLQELCTTLYFCREEDPNHFNLAEPIPGPSVDTFAGIAKKHSIVLIVPLFEKRAPGLFHNSAVVIGPNGDIIGHYRKMHIPHDPNFCEKYYFTPGDLGFNTIETPYGDIGVLICWDQWFPEAARLTALSGAQIIFYPTAIGWHPIDKKEVKQQMTGWETIQRGHAVANEVYVAAVNRVGKEGKLTFWGNSFVSDPFGSVIAQADGKDEENLVVECDLRKIEETRKHWPFLRDRRIDAYSSITKRFIDEHAAS